MNLRTRRVLRRVANQLLCTAFPGAVLAAFALGWSLAFVCYHK